MTNLKTDLKNVYFFAGSLKSELPHPIPLDPRGLATTLQKFAMAQTPPRFRRARPEKIPAPEAHPAIPHAPERWDVKDESH
jgi:hypothetical protein